MVDIANSVFMVKGSFVILQSLISVAWLIMAVELLIRVISFPFTVLNELARSFFLLTWGYII